MKFMKGTASVISCWQLSGKFFMIQNFTLFACLANIKFLII